MTATRTTANIMTMTVREKMPNRASFWRMLILTFQSKLTGIVMTLVSYQRWLGHSDVFTTGRTYS